MTIGSVSRGTAGRIDRAQSSPANRWSADLADALAEHAAAPRATSTDDGLARCAPSWSPIRSAGTRSCVPEKRAISPSLATLHQVIRHDPCTGTGDSIMAWRDGWGERYHPPSRPREAKGGIKAQSQQHFGESWWARRWIKVLEGFQIGARLGRGRSVRPQGPGALGRDREGDGPRPGPGVAAPAVRHHDPGPHDLRADWKKLARALTRQAVFAAKLLAGEMPQDIEQVFEEVGLSLFPARLGDLSTKCSCPDWSNPCKHIAAVYYLLGEEFDRDPFLIFALRGMSRDALMARLGEPGRPRARRLDDLQINIPIRKPLPPEPLTAESEDILGDAFPRRPLRPRGRSPRGGCAPQAAGTLPLLAR